MRCLVAFLALVMAAGSAHAGGDVGVVVTGPGALQNDVENHLESWLRAHGHAIVPSPMSHDAITTITNCFTIDDVKCARGVVEARSKAENERIAAEARREAELVKAESRAETQRLQAAADAETLRLHADAAGAYADHPVLLRVRELETLSRLATNAEARLYIGFDKHAELGEAE